MVILLNPVCNGSCSCSANSAAGWAGGFFGTFAGATRQSLAKFNTDGSNNTAFTCDLDSSGEALAMVYDSSRSRLWVAGNFVTMNGVTARRLACIDPDTGALIFDGALDGQCGSIVPDATFTYLYAAGGFSGQVGDVSVYRALRFNMATGVRDVAWAPVITAARTCQVAVPSPYSAEVFMGGSFTTLNGSARAGLGSVDLVTGTTTQAFNAVFNAGTTVNGMTVVDSSRLWVTGTFSTANGNTRNRLAQLDSTAAVTTWNATAPNLSGTALRIVPFDATSVLVAGTYATGDNGALTGPLLIAEDTGGFDASFQPGATVSGFGANCEGVAMGAASGQVYCATRLGPVDASSQRLFRLDPSGALDATFAPITTTTDPRQYVKSVCLLPAA